MIIWPILGLLLFAFMLVYRYKRERQFDYLVKQARHDAAREEALRTGNIFSKTNLIQVEERLKITEPHLNRLQRRVKAIKIGKLFVERVKAGLE